VPLFAGHRVHDEAPDLVAYAVQSVVSAAAQGDVVQLDQDSIVRHGGVVRVSAGDDRLTEWSSTGPRATQVQ
jgi:hypothetical protein